MKKTFMPENMPNPVMLFNADSFLISSGFTDKHLCIKYPLPAPSHYP